MSFNSEKCYVMHMGATDAPNVYTLGNKELQFITEERDLGVAMPNNCNWFKQMDSAVLGKATKMISWIFRSITSRSMDVLLPLNKALMRPQLEYCVQVWAPTPRMGNWTYIMCLENCQRKLTKRIEGFGLLSYQERLSKLGLTTLLERRARGDLIETFKILNGLVNYGHNMFCKSRSERNLLQLHSERLPKVTSFVKESNSTTDFKSKLELYKRNSIGNGSPRILGFVQEIFRRFYY